MKYLIKATELKQHLETGDTVFLDARGGANAYERFSKQHLKGAFFVDLEEEISTKSAEAKNGGRHPLPSIGKFTKLLGDLGIMPSTTVVVYDDKGGANAAARMWWMLRAVGHEQVYVVDGGLEALILAGLPMSQDDVILLTEFPSYPAINWELPLVNLADVIKATKDKDGIIIDVRENYRYKGESEPIDIIAGHIPTAKNFPYTENLTADGVFLDLPALKTKYENFLGDTPIDKVIVHCGSGVTACHTLLVLEELGLSGASLYVGSWSEWSRNDLSIETV